MSLSHVSAIAALFLSLSGGVSVAAGGGCPKPNAAPDTASHVHATGANVLGIDIGRAGNNPESRMVFFGQLSIEEKSDVCTHCRSALNTATAPLSADEQSFCQAILSVK